MEIKMPFTQNHVIESDISLLVSREVGEYLSDKLVSGWKNEYGDIVDFGGGIKDVSCKQIMQLCNSSPTSLRKLFPALTAAESKRIVEGCKEAIRTEW